MAAARFEYRYGTPALHEWTGAWKRHLSDPDVTSEEFDEVYDLLSEEFYGSGKHNDQSYFRGDNFGDRTQYFELIDRNVLTVELVHSLQELLTRLALWRWRILVVTYLEEDAILVYPGVVRYHARHTSLSAAVTSILLEMERRGLGSSDE